MRRHRSKLPISRHGSLGRYLGNDRPPVTPTYSPKVGRSMTLSDLHDAPEVMWAGRFITVKRQGHWEYVGRSRGIRAAAILAIDPEGRVILIDQYRVSIGRRCIELPETGR